MSNLLSFVISLILFNDSLVCFASKEPQECDQVDNEKIEYNQKGFSCKSYISANTTITIILDISKALQTDSVSNIPVITTSPKIDSIENQDGNQLSIMVISSKPDALFTNHIEQQGDRTVSTPLYFPQFLKQNASNPLQHLKLRISS